MPEMNVPSYNINTLSIMDVKAREAKKIDAAPKVLDDNIVDMTGKTDNATMAKDVQGALDSKKDVYFKTNNGIVKIPKGEVQGFLNDLKSKLLDGNFEVGGFNLYKDKNQLEVVVKEKVKPIAPEIQSAKDLGDGYQKQSEIKPSGPREIHYDDFNNPKGKIAILNSLTQNDHDSVLAHDQTRCGPSCIVAAVIKAEGLEGLRTLISVIKKSPEYDSLPQDMKDSLEKAYEEMNKRTLFGAFNRTFDMKNISVVQEALFQVLDKRENNWAADKKNIKFADVNAPGGEAKDKAVREGLQEATLNNMSISSFIHNNPEFEKMFKDKKLDITLIDNTGSGKGNHWVLFTKGEDGATNAVYDPYARSDNKQFVTDEKQVHKYELAKDKNNAEQFISRGDFAALAEATGIPKK
jgi:hypothetical protein